MERIAKLPVLNRLLRKPYVSAISPSSEAQTPATEESTDAPKDTYASLLSTIGDGFDDVWFGNSRTRNNLAIARWYNDRLYVVLRVKQNRSSYPMTETKFKIDQDDKVYKLESTQCTSEGVETPQLANLEEALSQINNTIASGIEPIRR